MNAASQDISELWRHGRAESWAAMKRILLALALPALVAATPPWSDNPAYFFKVTVVDPTGQPVPVYVPTLSGGYALHSNIPSGDNAWLDNAECHDTKLAQRFNLNKTAKKLAIKRLKKPGVYCSASLPIPGRFNTSGHPVSDHVKIPGKFVKF